MMIKALKNQNQLYIIFLMWLVLGVFAKIATAVLIFPVLFVLLKRKEYWWAVLGLLVLIIFSDNRNIDLGFAQTLKGIYLLLFAFYYVLVEKPFHRNSIFYFFIPFFLVSLLCIYWSENPLVTIQKTISYILLILIIPAVLIDEYKKKGKTVIEETILFIFIILVLSILIAQFLPGIGRLQMLRWNGALGNPNGLGIFLVLSYLFFELSQKMFPEVYSKQLRVVLYLMFIILIYKSGSRGAMLAVFAFWFGKVVMSFSVILGVIAISFFFIFLNEIYALSIQLIESFGYSEELRLDTIDEGSGRLIAWRFAWYEIQNNTFLIGKGIGYEVDFMQRNYKVLSEMGHEGNVHNSYLSFWLNTGLVGLITFFGSLILIFARSHKRNKLSLPILIACLVSMNFESWLSASLNPFTILLVILMTLLFSDVFYAKKRERSKKLGSA